jgi:hypothetical protein
MAREILIEIWKHNRNRNFTRWLRTKGIGNEVEDYNLDDLAKFYDDLHDLDHLHHHNIFSERSERVLYQAQKLFTGYFEIKPDGLIYECDIRTIKKIPSVSEYLTKEYKRSGRHYIRCGREFSL